MKMMIRNVLLVALLAFPLACVAQNFSDEYIEKNKGKYSIEVPEVQELVHILMALTPTGIADSNMVDHNTDYYKNVIETFGRYKDAEIVDKIDQKLKKGKYSRIKMDACGYYFDESDNIIKDQMYEQLNWSNKNYIEPFVSELEEFAKRSNFRAFYKDHKPYYNLLKDSLDAQVNIINQWKWLEKEFPFTYDHYRITFSPLVFGSHSTNRFESNGFKQTVMFISGPLLRTRWSKQVKSGLMTRVIFTEIDHNYVNPTSDLYKKEIKQIFKDREKWADAKFSSHYRGGYALFNEYMTWAVFSLYARENFSEDDFNQINRIVENQMVRYRGFIAFKEFNQMVLDLYDQENKEKNVFDLYPKILEWCKNSTL